MEIRPLISLVPRVVAATMHRFRARSTRMRADRDARARHIATLARLQRTKPERVLFVCYGNICRSPLAEVLARAAVSGSIAVASAGFHEVERRSSPENMLRAAEALGVDLSLHRSQRLTRELLNGHDLILVMDHQNFSRLVADFPDIDTRVAYLGPFGSSAVTISDPYGHDGLETMKVAHQIRDAIASLAARLHGHAPQATRG